MYYVHCTHTYIYIFLCILHLTRVFKPRGESCSCLFCFKPISKNEYRFFFRSPTMITIPKSYCCKRHAIEVFFFSRTPAPTDTILTIIYIYRVPGTDILFDSICTHINYNRYQAFRYTLFLFCACYIYIYIQLLMCISILRADEYIILCSITGIIWPRLLILTHISVTLQKQNLYYYIEITLISEAYMHYHQSHAKGWGGGKVSYAGKSCNILRVANV